MTDPAADLKYTAEHEWVAVDGDIATVGITAYAAEKLGDVVYVDLPKQGSNVASGKVVGEIESTKSVGELFAPASGCRMPCWTSSRITTPKATRYHTNGATPRFWRN